MNAIVSFEFGDQLVHISDRDGLPWFVLADVCRVLGRTNVAMAARRLDDDERDDLSINGPIGRAHSASVVNESGRYRLFSTAAKTRPNGTANG